MSRKIAAALVLAAAVVLVAVIGFALVPATAIQPIAPNSPCPAAGCASGACHGFDAVPEPDGVHEMTCPEAGCTSVECHGWDSLIEHHHQASDMSLNLWILMPVALVLGLWLLVRRMGRGSRAHGVAGVGAGARVDAEAPPSTASSARPIAGRADADEEESRHEA